MSSELKLSMDKYGIIIIENPQTDTISLNISWNDKTNSNTDKLSYESNRKLERERSDDKLNNDNTNEEYSNTQETIHHLPEKRRLYICCAKEDEEIGKKIYHILKCLKLEPWLLCEDILPGQNKQITVRTQIKNTDYVLVLLSSNINKRSNITCLKQAFHILQEEIPENEIYIIPILLEEEEEELLQMFEIGKFQHIDFFKPFDYYKLVNKILSSIGMIAKKDIIIKCLKDQEDFEKKERGEVQENSNIKRPKERL